MAKRQIEEYNWARIVLTILVVLSHCTYYKIVTKWGGINYSQLFDDGCIVYSLMIRLKNFLYLFHMPAFMALSGALFFNTMDRNSITSFSQLAAGKAKRLVIPFLFASVCYSIPIKFISGYYQDVNLVESAVFGQLLLMGNSHLWFLPALFFIFLIVYLLEKKYPGFMFVKCIIFVAMNLINSKVPIRILSDIFQYLLWFYCGYWFESVREHYNTKITKFTLPINALVLIIIYLIYYIFNHSSGLFWKIAAKSTKILASGLGIAVVYHASYALSKLKNRGKFCNLILNDSFGIYLYSDPINYALLVLLTSWRGSFIFTNNAGAILGFSLRFFITFFVSIGITELLKKLKLKFLY